MRPSLTEGRLGLSIGHGGAPSSERLRRGSGLFVASSVAAGVVAWVLRDQGEVLSSVLAWRLAFFALLAAGLLDAPFIGALWRGRAHVFRGEVRPVPFGVGEFRAKAPLGPAKARLGVTGRSALFGAGLLVLAVLVWMGGLAFAPLHSTGTTILRLGQRTSDVRPVGFRPNGVEYAYALAFEHSFLGLTEDGRGALIQAMEPASGETGLYELRFGQPVQLGSQRVALSALWLQPPVSGVRIHVDEPGGDQELNLRPGTPVQVGEGILELLEIQHARVPSGSDVARIRWRGPDGETERRLPIDPLRAGEAERLGEQPISAVEPLLTPRIELRFTETWVWWWRLWIGALAAAGAILFATVPHRSWIWLGRPGDFRLRVWSLNASASIREWSDLQLREALGEEGFRELLEIEAELQEMRSESEG